MLVARVARHNDPVADRRVVEEGAQGQIHFGVHEDDMDPALQGLQAELSGETDRVRGLDDDVHAEAAVLVQQEEGIAREQDFPVSGHEIGRGDDRVGLPVSLGGPDGGLETDVCNRDQFHGRRPPDLPGDPDTHRSGADQGYPDPPSGPLVLDQSIVVHRLISRPWHGDYSVGPRDCQRPCTYAGPSSSLEGPRHDKRPR